jgi:hypothetical protein
VKNFLGLNPSEVVAKFVIKRSISEQIRVAFRSQLQIHHPEWVQLNGELPMCDSYEAPLVELFDAFKRREREGTKRVKESLNPERWLCRHASFKALAHFVTIRMPLNRMNPSIQST